MRRPKLKRPSPGTVLGLLALIVAVAGNTGAFAGTGHKITKSDLAKGAVTAKALAKGAVGPKALAKEAVTGKALKKGAVGPEAIAAGAVGAAAIHKGAVSSDALAANAVTSSALAPGSVYGAALGPVEIKTEPIIDHDEVADVSTWTTSDTGTVLCAPGQRLLTGGVIFNNPGNRRVGIVRALPITNASANGYSGQITSDSGGTATAEVQAICLK
jgi:hypothetical protein